MAIEPAFTLEISETRLTDLGLKIYSGIEPGLGAFRSCGARLRSGRVACFHLHVESPCPLRWTVELEDSEGLESDVDEVLAALLIEE